MVKKKQDSTALVWIGILLAFIVLGFLSNAQFSDNQVTGYAIDDVTGEGIAETFLWPEGNTDFKLTDINTNVTKYLFIIMLTLLIWSVFDIVKFPKQNIIKWLFSVAISIIAISYITPSEIIVILTSFTALGLTLTTLLPFGVMVLFSVALLGEGDVTEMSVGKIMLQYMLWIFFICFLIYRLVILTTSEGINNWMVLTTAGALALSGIILLANTKFRDLCFNLGQDIKGKKIESLEADLARKEKAVEKWKEKESK